ncbi:MAG: hypothetical protein RLZZ568_1321 [Cyanobacteriota bacterium]|jgi:ribonuclease-3 family protein
MTQFHAHPLWQPLPSTPIPYSPRSLSPSALAYLGDAVFELYVRCRYLFPPRRIHDLHCQVVAQVRAEQQAHLLADILPALTDVEKEWVRRGRNAASTNRRASPQQYQAASGLETLLGYLYLTDPQRLDKLLALGLPAEPLPQR